MLLSWHIAILRTYMSFLDVLTQYAQNLPSTTSGTSQAHYNEIAPQVSPDMLSKGMAETFRSDQTPPFGDMVSQLFGQSSPQQQAGLLSQLLQSLGPAAISALGAGVLGRVLGHNNLTPSGQVPTITPAQASQVSPEDVREIALRAEQHQPGIVNNVSDFFAQHPDLIKGIGAMGLAVLLGKMARR